MTRRYLPAEEREAIAARYNVAPNLVPNVATIIPRGHGQADQPIAPRDFMRRQFAQMVRGQKFRRLMERERGEAAE